MQDVTYYSKSAKKKIEMFNEVGEIAIFKKTGLQPVFFGETIIGPKLPNHFYFQCTYLKGNHRDNVSF